MTLEKTLKLAGSFLKIARVFVIAIVASFCIIFYMGLRELGKIVEEALQSSVFSKNISKRLIHLAWYVIVGGMINILSVIVSALRINSMNLMQIFNPSVVTGIDLQYSYDISFIAVAFVLFLLAKVFAYGAQLQQLSDETL